MALHFEEIYFNVMMVWKAHQIVKTWISFTDLDKVNYPDFCPILYSACETKHFWLINLDFSSRRQVVGCCPSLSRVWLFVTPWTRAYQLSLAFISWSLFRHLLSRWCHPTISSSAVPFSSCLQSFQASGSFVMSKFFASGGQSIGVLASLSILPVNIQDWFPFGLTGLTSL